MTNIVKTTLQMTLKIRPWRYLLRKNKMFYNRIQKTFELYFTNTKINKQN